MGDGTVQEKLDQIIRTLAERSERLDRFESGLSALGKQVNSQAILRLDRCARHVNAPGGDCVTCVANLNKENRSTIAFLLEGITSAADMLHRSRNLERDGPQIRNLLLGLLAPPVAKKQCQLCEVEIEHILTEGAVPTGPGVWGIEGVAFDKDTLEQKAGLLCYPCSLKPQKPVQPPAPKSGTK